MYVYASSTRCGSSWDQPAHLCDECYVEYVLPSLDIVMTNWATYKLVVA